MEKISTLPRNLNSLGSTGSGSVSGSRSTKKRRKLTVGRPPMSEELDRAVLEWMLGWTNELPEELLREGNANCTVKRELTNFLCEVKFYA